MTLKMGLDPLVSQRPLIIIFHLFPAETKDGEILSPGSSPVLLLLYSSEAFMDSSSCVYSVRFIFQSIWIYGNP